MTQKSNQEPTPEEIARQTFTDRLQRIKVWKQGEPLPEPKTIPDNPEHDATRNDYIRVITENNRLVQELQKLRAEVPLSVCETERLQKEVQGAWTKHNMDSINLWKDGDPLNQNSIITDRKPPVIRAFDTGATRSSDAGRYDPEGFLSPIVIERFCEYMNRNRIQADGSTRASDNWQAGIPLDQYMKGMHRHFLHAWTRHRGFKVMDQHAAADIRDDLCAILFNASGYLFELLKEECK